MWGIRRLWLRFFWDGDGDDGDEEQRFQLGTVFVERWNTRGG